MAVEQSTYNVSVVEFKRWAESKGWLLVTDYAETDKKLGNLFFLLPDGSDTNVSYDNGKVQDVNY